MQNFQRRFLPSTAALMALDAVARLGSFSAAAEELNLTQGAISRQIAALEEQLGLRLFHRTARGVSVTPRGHAFHAATRSALGQIQTAALEAVTGLVDNRLNIAILPTFGTRWLMPRMAGFVARHPEVTLNFATRIGQFDFAVEEIDAAIHIGQADWPGTRCIFLMDEVVAPVCSPGFLETHRPLDHRDLLHLPLIHMKSRPDAWSHWFGSLGIAAPPKAAMGFEQFMAVAQACIGGLGVALMPLFLIAPEVQTGQLVLASQHRVKSQSNYYLVVPEGREHRPPVAAFASWLMQEVERFGHATPPALSAIDER